MEYKKMIILLLDRMDEREDLEFLKVFYTIVKRYFCKI